MMAASPITLITDFGNRDGYVGAMKGVIFNIYPQAAIVDISHEVSPQNIDEAAFLVMTTYKYFPKGSIHVVVVDPGVGGERRIICASAFDYFFLAPDNGVLKFIFRKCNSATVYAVENASYFLPNVSRTFHGRDIFAPVAAHLARGVPIEEIGSPILDYQTGRLPSLDDRGDEVIGEIIYIDRFGNLISNIPFNKLARFDETQITVQIGATIIHKIVDSYFAGKIGEPIALIGSAGFLEIAVNSGHAQTKLRSTIGDEVRVWQDE